MDSGQPPESEIRRELFLAFDLDTRMAEIWTVVWSEIAEENQDLVGALLRLAYTSGYTDALTEKRRGQLYRDHGYAVPRRAQ